VQLTSFFLSVLVHLGKGLKSMVIAIVLLCVIPGDEYRVQDELLELEEVKKASITFGEYDLFLEVQVPKIKMLGPLISRKIRQIEGVQRTVTLIQINQDFGEKPD
jgi:DNA-binding Lrp family transcriptional regulator